MQGVWFTSYNPEVGQTDDSPCVGAAGQDLCDLAKHYYRSIALSRDLVSHTGQTPFHYGDHVVLESTDYPDDPRCNGEFTVLDTMAAKYSMRGDIFFMERADNTSCTADIYKLGI